MDIIALKKEDLEVGSLYILFYMDKYIICKLVGSENRYSIKITKKILNGKEIEIKEPNIKMYPTAIIKAIDNDNLSKSPILSKMFNIEDSKEQFYFTNHILFNSNFMKFNSYEWLVNHMLKLNAFKISEKNIDIALRIASSMFKKECSNINDDYFDKKIFPIFKKVSSEISDEIEARMIAIKQHHLNQLPF